VDGLVEDYLMFRRPWRGLEALKEGSSSTHGTGSDLGKVARHCAWPRRGSDRLHMTSGRSGETAEGFGEVA